MESHGAVSLSVGRSVGRSVGQSVSQLVRKKEKSVFPVTGRVVICIYICILEGRRKEAEGSINIGKCQDSRRRPIYTTTIVATVLNLIYAAGYIRDLSGLLKLFRS